jgi:hypothetical protein
MARRKGRRFLLYLVIIVLGIFLIKVSLVPRLGTFWKTTPYKVYVALGFHTNLYHSYRGDENDEAGFGKDIRIIRHTIKTMNEHNASGSKVKAVWDFDNLFTLEEILPRYAPDIITDIKKRVNAGTDEIILMSYDNGLASAMTKDELTESIKMAISNPNGSGVKDVFRRFTPIVRPQEGMTSPGSFPVYKELGVEGVVLYYSAVPFDNLRVFLPELTMEEALNPLTYKNKATGDEMTVIPAYNVGDLIENVSLTKWARDVHRMQLTGKVKGDVLIFVNFDADDTYWDGYDLPIYLSWLPNTGGIGQLIDEADGLDYVEFTTLSEYLKNHKAKKEISFGQDTADGNFEGYNPWAEKSTSHDYWTSLMEDRRNHEAVVRSHRAIELREYNPRKGAPPKTPAEFSVTIPPEEQELLDNSFALRMRLLSTTHFGMATPLLCADREFAATKIIREMLAASRAAREAARSALAEKLGKVTPPKPPLEGMKFIDSFLALSDSQNDQPPGFVFVTFDLSGLSVPDERFYVLGSTGTRKQARIIASHLASDGTIGLVTLSFLRDEGAGPYFLFWGPRDAPPASEFKTTAAAGVLSNDMIRVEVSTEGVVKTVVYDKKKYLNEKSLLPRIAYRPKDKEKTIELSPKNLKVAVEKDGSDGIARIRIFGDFAVPEVKGSEPGFIDYRMTLIDGVPYLFLDGEITYPRTPKKDLMGIGKPVTLLRKIDRNWYEVSPAELLVSFVANKKAPFTIIKRDFCGVDSSYVVDYFKHSDENLNLANVNNHITAAYAALVGGGSGIAVAMDNTMHSDFAFMPIKITYGEERGTFSARVNPFGTYFGPLYYQPTWGKRLGYEAALLSGESYKSSAPSYNGYREHFSLMIAFLDKGTIPDNTKADLLSFADPPIVVSGGKMGVIEGDPTAPAPAAPEGIIAAPDNGDTYILWDKARGNPQSYKVYLGTESGKYANVYETKNTKLLLKDLITAKTYYVSVAALFPGGKELGPTEEISFVAGAPAEAAEGLKVPLRLQLKILWQGLLALIN